MENENRNKAQKKTNTAKLPSVARLRYKSGQLIIKEGDYGVSIYKIISGKVLVYQESSDVEVPLSRLGPGEIFGEMAFLSKAMEPRASSVRALEDTELEALHPSLLSREYEQMPPILKYIANQALKRLVRMNGLAAKLGAELKSKKKEIQQGEGATRRNQYRKNVHLECTYRPLGASSKVRLSGLIRDISIGGVGMEVRGKSLHAFRHNEGDKFYVEVLLPNEKLLNFSARVESVRRSETPGRTILGMAFIEVSDESRKILGFFMM